MTGSKTSALGHAAYALNGIPRATGAITLIAIDEVWRAIPGRTTGPATQLVYRTRPDYSAPAALDPQATPVDLANWRLEMQMHFAYTTAQSVLATAILDSVGLANHAALKVAHHPTPLHSLSPLEMIEEMFRKHAALTGPDLQKLRAPLLEPLLAIAIADIETHMTSFMLASMKLSATGHGEDPCRYFEGFLATIQGFPLIVTAIAGYYNTHPLVANKTIATLFAYLTPQVPHLIAQTGTVPFSGGASTPALKGNKGKKNNSNPGKRQQRPKAAWGNWPTSASPGSFAGASWISSPNTAHFPWLGS
jgi:hypothetical protein